MTDRHRSIPTTRRLLTLSVMEARPQPPAIAMKAPRPRRRPAILQVISERRADARTVIRTAATSLLRHRLHVILHRQTITAQAAQRRISRLPMSPSWKVIAERRRLPSLLAYRHWHKAPI